jgi:hypothetical protein
LIEVIDLSDQETTGQETAEPETEAQETVKEEPLSEEQSTEEAKETPKVPEPTAIGDEKIAILKHDIYRKGGDDSTAEMGIEMVVKNVSDKMIGSVLFEAVLYDIEGKVLDTVEHKTIKLDANRSRTIRITSSAPESDKVKSYHVRLAKTVMTPEPTATGNEKVIILKHSLSKIIDLDRRSGGSTGAELAIRNVSDSTIATLVFEALFYDIEGNILDIVKHKEVDLKPNFSRAILISTSILESDRVESYDVRIIRTTTADVEKVQLRKHEIRTTEAGEEEVSGIVKNLSNVKTDAALVATFYDSKKENIGTKVIILRDIEPNSIKQYHFKFKPQEGDRISAYSLNIGEIVG